MRTLLILLALVLATGCATTAPRVDSISFDRGAFALLYADVSQMVKKACAKPTSANTAECARMDEVDKSVRKSIVTPPTAAPASGGIDVDAIMKMIGVLGKLAL